jgi:hypothetical protein
MLNIYPRNVPNISSNAQSIVSNTQVFQNLSLNFILNKFAIQMMILIVQNVMKRYQIMNYLKIVMIACKQQCLKLSAKN